MTSFEADSRAEREGCRDTCAGMREGQGSLVYEATRGSTLSLASDSEVLSLIVAILEITARGKRRAGVQNAQVVGLSKCDSIARSCGHLYIIR